MIRLFYVSTASASVDQKTIDQIVTKSNVWNVEHDITGALSFNGKNFGQILEGPEANVLMLMDLLKSDKRHSGLVEIRRISITQRAFYDWGLKLIEGPDFKDFIAIMHE